MELSQREKRSIKICLIFVIVSFALVYLPKGMTSWRDIRQSIKDMEKELELATGQSFKQRDLGMIVPILEMPRTDPEQLLLFREKMNNQFKQAGVETDPVQVKKIAKPNKAGYQQYHLSYKGQCRFNKFLDLMASFKENPYLAGIERLKFQYDTKKKPQERKDMDMELTVSTFVKVKK